MDERVKGIYDDVKLLTDLLAYADGKHDLIRISEMICQPVDRVMDIAKILAQEELIIEVEESL